MKTQYLTRKAQRILRSILTYTELDHRELYSIFSGLKLYLAFHLQDEPESSNHPDLHYGKKIAKTLISIEQNRREQ